MEIKIIKESVSKNSIKEIAEKQFGNMVKAVVDTNQEIIAVGGELHADMEAALTEQGSKRENVWGVNLYPEKSREEWVEFDSMINLKPQLNNRSRNVENPEIQSKIIEIVNKLITE